MTEFIEVRRFQPPISHARSTMWRTPGMMSDPFYDEYYMNRRYNSVQTLPMIGNPQSYRYRNHFQDVYNRPMMEPPPYPYGPSTSFIDDRPFVYERAYTPSLIEESPYAFYEPCETPVRRRGRATPSNDKKVHLPQHAKKLVNRFLNNLEHAHEHQVSFVTEI
jgi:hypothetical protein